MWLRLAWREIINSRKFSLLFCVNLALGLTGFLTIDAFRVSLNKELRSGSKNLQAADLSITVTSRDLTEQEQVAIEKELPEASKRAQVTSLFSMAVAKNKQRSRLSNISAISALHPLYGKLVLEKQGSVNRELSEKLRKNHAAWAEPELLIQLGISVGDQVQIGHSSFTISDIVKEDPTASASAFAFAPRIYVSLDNLPATKLLVAGSRYRHRHLYKFPSEESLETAVKNLKETLPASDIRIRSHEEASENLARSLTYLSDYLGLIALVALFLAAIGSGYLFRSLLFRRLQQVAILMSVGATGAEARRIYILQLLILGLVTSVLTIALTFVGLPYLPMLTEGLLPVNLQPQIHLESMIITFLIATLGSLLICVPLLSHISQQNPAQLFQEGGQAPNKTELKNLLWFLPLLLLYWLLAIWEAKSIPVGTVFIAALLGACAAFGLLSNSIFLVLARLTRSMGITVKLAMRQLARNRLSTSACFLTIAVGSLLIALIPQIQNIVMQEIRNPPGFTRPGLFLVDVQEEQLPELQKLLASQDMVLRFPSPLIRARLTKVNGAVAGRINNKKIYTREQRGEQWVRNRGYNLSYQAGLKTSERLIKGREFSGSFDPGSQKLPEVSLEMRFAKRLNISVGDTATFDIQGVAVTGRVVNIRQIKWTSFHPNFFVQFQPGVLDDAPKTYISVVDDAPLQKKVALQNSIVAAFPNISIVDIAKTVQRILGVLERMVAIVNLMAYFTLFAGFIVLYSIANHQATMRRWDTNLLKVLGADFSQVYRVLLIEFGTLGLVAATGGILISFVISFTLSLLIFDSPWTIDGLTPVYIIAAVTGVVILTVLLATRRTLGEKPLALLNQN